jgi:hypothetical protein
MGTKEFLARGKVAVTDTIEWLANAGHRRALTAAICFISAKAMGDAFADADVSAFLTLIVTIGGALWVPTATVESDGGDGH